MAKMPDELIEALLHDALKKLVHEAKADSLRYFPNVANDLPHVALALCGEAGEFANIVKKVDRGSLTLEDAASSLRSELADILVYYLCACGLVPDTDPLGDYRAKVQFNDGRFGHV